MSTYAELQDQIKHLQQQAEALRAAEKNQVIADVRALIAQYGITSRDLGLANGVVGVKSKAPAMVRFVGPHGETWSGRGRQPQWFKDALASGKTEMDLRIS